MFSVNEIKYEHAPKRILGQMQQESQQSEKNLMAWSPMSKLPKGPSAMGNWGSMAQSQLNERNMNTPAFNRSKNFVDLSESPPVQNNTLSRMGQAPQEANSKLLEAKNINQLLVVNSIDKYSEHTPVASQPTNTKEAVVVAFSDNRRTSPSPRNEQPIRQRQNNFRPGFPGGRGPRLSDSPLVDKTRETLTLEAINQYILDHFENPRLKSPVNSGLYMSATNPISQKTTQKEPNLKRAPNLSPWVNPKIEAENEVRTEDMTLTPKVKKVKPSYSPLTKTGSTVMEGSSTPRMGKAVLETSKSTETWEANPFAGKLHEIKKEESNEQWSPVEDSGSRSKTGHRPRSAKKNPYSGIEACLTSIKPPSKGSGESQDFVVKKGRGESYIPSPLESILSNPHS